jgi:hypothetical protein
MQLDLHQYHSISIHTPQTQQATMPPKRKREEEKDVDSVFRPPAGTRTYETGQAVKEGLASGSRQGEYLFLDRKWD